MANKSHYFYDRCILGFDVEEKKPLAFSLQTFTNYCVLFDTLSNQIAFAPKLVNLGYMEWNYCL
ncbi:unnamed protein product [Meloidogyne enterolobii]|uniref:Uncharacterized protein n=1 Tax=Meloidogyne enterolobii TaxID=390850 RepID=A0ACB0Z5U9_MELEN